MLKVSYSDLFGIRHERDHDEHIEAGDLVRTGPNMRPQFSVIALDGDKAWLRNTDNGHEGIVAVNRCRKVHEPAHEHA